MPAAPRIIRTIAVAAVAAALPACASSPGEASPAGGSRTAATPAAARTLEAVLPGPRDAVATAVLKAFAAEGLAATERTPGVVVVETTHLDLYARYVARLTPRGDSTRVELAAYASREPGQAFGNRALVTSTEAYDRVRPIWLQLERLHDALAPR